MTTRDEKQDIWVEQMRTAKKAGQTKVKEGHHDLSERQNTCVRKGNTEASQGRKRAGRVK